MAGRELEHTGPSVQVQEIPPWLHARHHALRRTYVYRIIAPIAAHDLSIFEYNRAWMLEEELALAPMREAAAVLLGTHDFTSFRAAGAPLAQPRARLSRSQVARSLCLRT